MANKKIDLTTHFAERRVRILALRDEILVAARRQVLDNIEDFADDKKYYAPKGSVDAEEYDLAIELAKMKIEEQWQTN